MKNVMLILGLMLAVACAPQVGPKGDAGVAGPIGATGPQGDPGKDATPVTTIQFCKGYTPTYPTSFPESGVCIDNKLYAVYYDGSHAFLALIPPGLYQSTSPQWCTFTVLPNCQIQ